MSIPPLDQQICFMTNAAARKFVSAYKPLLKPYDLTYPQYLVMLCLWNEDGVSLDDIGKQVYLDSGTLTPLIKRLEVAGLVVRTRKPEDERRLVIKLTAKGQSLKSKVPDIMCGITNKLALSEHELTEFRKYLCKLLDGLND